MSLICINKRRELKGINMNDSVAHQKKRVLISSRILYIIILRSVLLLVLCRLPVSGESGNTRGPSKAGPSDSLSRLLGLDSFFVAVKRYIANLE